MFIIFGSPRSGTTFLRESMNQHPDIVVPHETDFIVPLAYLVDRITDADIGRRLVLNMIVATKGFAASLGRYLSADEVELHVMRADYTVPSILHALYSAVAEKSGAKIAGDKSPNDLGALGILQGTQVLNSHIKLVHIVRDVRDVMLSLQNTGWLNEHLAQSLPGIWNNTNLNLRRFAMQTPDNYFFIRYEDLVMNPAASLAPLCEFLGVPFDSNMLEWHNLGKDLRHLPHHRNLGQPPLVSRCFAWKNKPENYSWAVAATAALQEFGYEPASETR
jgi:hypothetical protein